MMRFNKLLSIASIFPMLLVALWLTGTTGAQSTQSQEPPTTQPAGGKHTPAPAPTEPAKPVDPNPPAPGFHADESDEKAIALADETMNAMGGREAWGATRWIQWSFFAGRRQHLWDKHTGDVRIEYDDPRTGERIIILVNINDKTGKAFRAGDEVIDEEALNPLLETGYRAWINDSYWLFMPYKLKDSGVTLKYKGEEELEPGRVADVIVLTFDDVGVTPQNKYEVFIARDTKLIEKWAFYSNADDAEPRISTPWGNWKKYGSIMLSDDRGEGRKITSIEVFDSVPKQAFTQPETLDFNAPPEPVRAPED